MAIQVDKRTLSSAGPAAVDTPSAAGTTHATDPLRAAASGRASQPQFLPREKTSKPTTANVDYARLMAKLSAGDRSPKSLNALGVCHLRLGNYAEAVRIYRGLTLQPGCTWEREDVPPVYRRNFATALLLAGLPAGCLSVLQAPGLADHPRSREIFEAIQRWQRSLTFFQRWDWRLNGVAPKDCQIPIDFEPGEFE